MASDDEVRVYVSGDASKAVEAMRQVGDSAQEAADKVEEGNARVSESSESATEKVEELGAALDEVGGKDTRPRVDADTADADEKLDRTKERLDELDATTADPHLDVDDEDLTTKVESRRQALKAFGDQTFSPHLDADDEELQQKLDDNIAKVDELNHRYVEIRASLKGDASEELDALDERLNELNAEVYEPDVSARGVDETRARLDELEADLQALSDKWATPGVRLMGDADALARLEAVSVKIAELKDQVAQARVAVDGDVVSEGKLSTIEASLLRLSKLVATPDIELEGVARSEGQLATLQAQLATLRGVASDLKALTGEAAQPGVRVEGVTDAVARLTVLKERIDAVKGEIATTRVALEGDTVAEGKLSAIEASLLRLGTTVSSPRIDLQGVADSEAKLAVLNGRLDALKEKAVNVQTGDSAAKLDQVAKSAQNAQQATFSAGQAALLAAPALIDIGMYGAAGMLSVGAMAVTAATGMGAFLLAADGLKGVRADLAGVLQQWRQLEAPVVQPALVGFVDVARQGLADLSPLVAGVSQGLQQLEQTASAALGGPFWHGFFDFLGGQAATDLQTFGHLIGGLADTLSGLYQAFAPVISDVEGGLNQLAGDMVNFGHGATTNSGLHEFVTWLVNQSTPVGNTLHQIAADVVGLVRDVLPLGPPLIAVVHGVADLVGLLEHISPGLVTVGVGVAAVAKVAGALKPAFSAGALGVQDFLNSVDLLARTDGVTAVSGFGKAIENAGKSLSDMAGKSGTVAGALDMVGLGFLKAQTDAEQATVAARTFAVDSSGVATEVTSAGAGISSGIGAAAAGVLAATAIMLTAYAQIPPAVGAAQRSAENFGQTVASSVVSNIEASGKPIDAQIAALQAYKQQLQTTAEAALASEGIQHQSMSRLQEAASAGWKPAEEALGTYQGKVTSVDQAIAALRAGQDGAATGARLLGSATNQAVSPTQALDNELKALTAQANAASTAASNFSSALSALDGNQLSAQQNLVTTAQDFNSLTAALKTSKGELDGNSTSALAAKSALITFGQQINTTTASMVQAHAPMSAINAYLDDQRNRLLALEGQYPGLRSQISQYISELHLTPADIQTQVKLAGVAEAHSQLAGLQAQLAGVARAYTAQVNVEVHQLGFSAPVGMPLGTTLRAPGYASGTTNHPGGIALVGEQGPELAVLPRGTTVIPHRQTVALLGAGIPAYAAGTPDMAGGGGGSSATLGPFIVNAMAQVDLGLEPAAGGVNPRFVTAGRQIVNSLLAGMKSAAPVTDAEYAKLADALPAAVVQAIYAAQPKTVGALRTMLTGMQTAAHTALADLAGGLNPPGPGYTGPLASLVTGVDNATKAINQAFKGTELQSVVDAMTREFGRLATGSSTSLAAVTNRLAAAQQAVATIKQEIASTSQQIQSGYSIIPPAATAAAGPTAVGAPADAQDLTTAITATATNLGNNQTDTLSGELQGQLQQLQQFNADLKTLASWGLDQHLLMMLAQAGYSAGLPVAAQLIGAGKQAIAPLNTLEASLNAQEQQLAAVANPTVPAAPPAAPPTVQEELHHELDQLKAYHTILKQLAADGLDQALLTQLVQAGYQAGMPVAKQLLASGIKGIKAANYLEGQVESQANSIAGLVSKANLNGKQVGLSTAEGIVSELQKQQKKIEKEMRTLAEDMRSAIQDALGAKGAGPAMVFERIGGQIVDGLAAGIHGHTTVALNAITDLIGQMTQKIKADLKISSPSGLFMEYGSQVAEGFALGITGNAGLATNAVAQLGTAAGAGRNLGADLHPAGAGAGRVQITYAPQVRVVAQGDISPRTARFVTTKISEQLAQHEQKIEQQLLAL